LSRELAEELGRQFPPGRLALVVENIYREGPLQHAGELDSLRFEPAGLVPVLQDLGDGVRHVLLDRRAARHAGNRLAFAAPGQTVTVTSEQMAMISADPAVMHGQAVIAGTRVPVSVILDCIAAGMTIEQITAEYPTVTAAGVRAAAAYGAALAREELLPIPQSR
jgi:uncharacterized protein (DUF433 family)